MSDERAARQRSDPITVAVGQSELTLTSSEVNALIAAMEAWRHVLSKQLDQVARDKPQGLEAATRRIGRLEQLEDLLVRKSSSDPPLELDADQAKLVEETLGELTRHERGELTGGLRELRLALYRL